MKTLLQLLLSLLSLISFSQNKLIVKNLNDDSLLYAHIIRLPVILFMFDKYDLGHPSHPIDSIKLIAGFLNKNKTLTIEVGNHMDYRWDPKYSTNPSFNRAKTIWMALIDSFGIDPQRVTPKGYGDSTPRYLEKDVTTPSGKIIAAGTILSEKWIDLNFPKTKNKDDYEFIMALNRRTEIKILRKDYVPKVIFTLRGKVTINGTQKPIARATVKLIGSDNTSLEIKTDSSGNYYFDWTKLNANTTYVISASALDVKDINALDGYLGNPKAKITTVGLNESFDFAQDFQLIRRIFHGYFPAALFEKGSSELTTSIKDTLKFVVTLLKENPNITIEISCHSSYDEKKIKKISYQRAKKICDYLIAEKGIDPNRVSPQGYGETTPRYLEMDYTLPSGTIIPRGTQLSKEWIEKNISEKDAPKDYEYVMKLNRRAVFRILRKDYKPIEK